MKGLCSWLCDGHKSEAVASGGPGGGRVGGGRHRGQVFGRGEGQRSWWPPRVLRYFGSGGGRLGFGLGVVGRVKVRGKLGFLFGLG